MYFLHVHHTSLASSKVSWHSINIQCTSITMRPSLSDSLYAIIRIVSADAHYTNKKNAPDYHPFCISKILANWNRPVPRARGSGVWGCSKALGMTLVNCQFVWQTNNYGCISAQSNGWFLNNVIHKCCVTCLLVWLIKNVVFALAAVHSFTIWLYFV